MDAQQQPQQKDLDQLLQRLDNAGLGEYVRLSQKTGKILWLNFLSGVARGLGFSVGASLVLAIVYKILSRIISMPGRCHIRLDTRICRKYKTRSLLAPWVVRAVNP
jgi:hypothetical protein